MDITLDRLKDFEGQIPGRGEISIAIARHASEAYPSSEAYEYAAERSTLVHRIVDDLDIPVSSWGETDLAYPREVVEIVIPILAALIPVISDVLMKCLERRSQGKEKPSVPGFKITRSDGATLMLTYRDRQGPLDQEMQRLIGAFLTKGS